MVIGNQSGLHFAEVVCVLSAEGDDYGRPIEAPPECWIGDRVAGIAACVVSDDELHERPQQLAEFAATMNPRL